MSASWAIFRAAGSPADDAWAGDEPGTCRLCGTEAHGMSFRAWVRPTFTDHDILHPGTIVCTACLFCAQERTEWMAVKSGSWWSDSENAFRANPERVAAARRKLRREPSPSDIFAPYRGGWCVPQRTRNYSHFVVRGEWRVLSKARKREMTALLLEGPEVAVIADSGQRHLVFRARVGWWQFELAPPIRPDVARFSRLLSSCTALYAAGAPKAEIESGRWTQPTLRRAGMALVREHDHILIPGRGTPMLRLAVFLTQMPEGSPDERSERDDVRIDGDQYAFA